MLGKAKRIMRLLTDHGASGCFIVGGFVRDHILGLDSKDIDIEVYGMDYESICRVLQSGWNVDIVGQSFGVVKVDNEIDVSIPRKDNKVGVGHKGFDVILDPAMKPEEAAARRDFTINSMFMDIDGRIFDPYGGQMDLRRKILRATSKAFAEDPLRVLRGMQFCSRFNLVSESHTDDMCFDMIPTYSELAKERLWPEWEKWAKLGKYPSMGLRFLKTCGWHALYPEITALNTLPQDQVHHPEGDVLEHTIYVCDAASQIADREGLNEDDRLVLMLAALCHDFGKATTTELTDGRWTSHGHDKAGEEPTKSFLTAINAPHWVIEQVVPLVVEHMAHVHCDATPRVVRRLANRLHPSNLKMWSLLCEADHSGRPPLPAGNPTLEWLEVGKEVKVENDKPKPILMGRHLLDIGWKPGPKMGKSLKSAFEAQLDGAFSTPEQGIEWLITSTKEQ